MESIILSTAYFPPINYMALICRYNNIYIEYDENYTKQSYRNRCEIYGTNGRQVLSVPVKKSSEPKTLVSDIVIDYDTNWTKIHWRSIESAYRNSPFYEFYVDYFVPFYTREYKYLCDFNMQILNTLLEVMEVDKSIQVSENYEKKPLTMDDYRYMIHPKKKGLFNIDGRKELGYNQVFSEKHGFISNLSILDLLFNEGPNSCTFLESLYSKEGS